MTSQFFEPGYRAGGPIRSVARIVDTAPAETDIVLMTSDRDLGSDDPYPDLSGRWVERGRAKVFYLNPTDAAQRKAMAHELRKNRFDLLYVNSLFNPRFSLAPIIGARIGRINGARVLIAPRGELSGGALSLKASKKRHFLAAWLRFLHGMDVTWHATSDMEVADIRSVAPKARIEVCPDQGDLPVTSAPGHQPQKTPRLVFLSRISRMKNLDLALKALAGIDTPMAFDIYGPIEDQAYWRECQALIPALPDHVTVQYRGEVDHASVRDVFGAYDAFLLPTKGESFGHVIAEALSASCPVICSDKTPWTPVLRSGGGVVTALSVPDVVAAIARTVSMTPGERQRAKRDAGAAYRVWLATASDRNIIGQVLGLA